MGMGMGMDLRVRVRVSSDDAVRAAVNARTAGDTCHYRASFVRVEVEVEVGAVRIYVLIHLLFLTFLPTIWPADKVEMVIVIMTLLPPLRLLRLLLSLPWRPSPADQLICAIIAEQVSQVLRCGLLGLSREVLAAAVAGGVGVGGSGLRWHTIFSFF